jgi:hypothetical protein
VATRWILTKQLPFRRRAVMVLCLVRKLVRTPIPALNWSLDCPKVASSRFQALVNLLKPQSLRMHLLKPQSLRMHLLTLQNLRMHLLKLIQVTQPKLARRIKEKTSLHQIGPLSGGDD